MNAIDISLMDIDKFVSCFDAVADDCWLWHGLRGKATNPRKYGGFCINKVMYSAHRIAWALNHGPIPAGLQVLHKCDVPSCVNPSHLFLGTNKDNMADKARKGRASTWGPNGKPIHIDESSNIQDKVCFNIKAIAKIKGMTLKSIAETSGITYGALKGYFNGVSMTMETLSNIASALGYTLVGLIQWRAK